MVSSTSNNTTIFNNVTIAWETFNLFSCAIPQNISVSVFTCSPPPSYTVVNDINCLNAIFTNFNMTSCNRVSATTFYTLDTTTITQQTTLWTSTNNYAQVKII